MATNRFQYQLIRFVPDLARMEPRNIGVVVQGAGEIDVKLNRRFTTTKEGRQHADTIKEWFNYFEKEIKGSLDEDQGTNVTMEQVQVPLSSIMPDRGSEKFLGYLMKKASGQMRVTKPFIIEYREEKTLEDTLNATYSQFVSSSDDAEETLQQPTRSSTSLAGKFNKIAGPKKFRERGLLQDRNITLPDNRPWFSYRYFNNDALNLIEKLEFGNHANLSGMEAQKLMWLLGDNHKGVFDNGIKLKILIDPFRPFDDLPDEENKKFSKYREEIGNRAIGVGAQVIETDVQVSELVNYIDEHLGA